MLPTTLAEILAMGRDALDAIVRCYMAAFGLDHWDITARWVESLDNDLAVGSCMPDPVYNQALIEIVWPPRGDLEETVAHEVAHCLTAELAMLAGAEPGTWARAAWERVAEQTARGAVALRRSGKRVPQVLSRVFRGTVAALRRTGMDPKKLAELAMMAGQMAGRDDVPEDVRQFLTELVTALAGGGGSDDPADPAAAKPDPGTGDPQPGTDPNAPHEQQPPAYMRQLIANVDTILRTVQAPERAALPTTKTPPVSPELAEMRRTSVETFLAGKPVLSAAAERELIESGDLKLAKFVVAEVERKQVERGGQRPPNVDPAPGPKLTPMHKAAAARHKVSEKSYATALERQNLQRRLLGGK